MLLHIVGREILGYEWLHWHLHPDVIFLCVGLMAMYLYTIHVLRPRISDAGRVRRDQTVYFSLGVLVIYIAAGSPVHDLSERYLLSVHMFQHLLFTLVAAPLLLAGIPGWVWSWVLQRKGVLPVARYVLHPVTALVAFNFMIVITHLPHVADYALREHWFHLALHGFAVTTALMMWRPVITDVPEMPRLSYPYQMFYLFLHSLLPAVVASFFTFSTTAVYPFYAEVPRIWGMSAVDDQQVAAGLMKVVGSLILWGFILVAFFKWFALEEAESRGPRWADVEEELQEMGLSVRK